MSGELHQLQWAGNLEITEAEYIQVVSDKTACLISACTQCGALIAQAPEEIVEKMRIFGLGLGMAFQITDDIMDFTADPEELGKAIGNDIAHGKITLPLIHFLANSTHPEPAIAMLTGKNGKDKFDLAKAVQSTGSIDYARNIALQYINQAKQQLDEVVKSGVDSKKIQHLKQLSDFVVNRRF